MFLDFRVGQTRSVLEFFGAHFESVRSQTVQALSHVVPKSLRMRAVREQKREQLRVVAANLRQQRTPPGSVHREASKHTTTA